MVIERPAGATLQEGVTGPVPSVSVVIPTHDRRPLLQRALGCVLAQEGVTLDVVVVDDGSSDDTADFLEGLADPRVRTVRHRHAKGLPNARNAGLAHAECPWVAFLDDDDLWGPTRLSTQLEVATRTGAGWVCSDVVLTDRRLTVLGVQAAPHDVDVTREIFGRNVVPGGGSGVLARTELVREVGAFDPSLPSLEDWDLWMRLAMAAPPATVARADVGYYLHAGNMSRHVTTMRRARNMVLSKHASERRARGVVVDDGWWDSYMLDLALSSGNRAAAGRVKLRTITGSRNPRDLVALLAMLAIPRAVGQRHQNRSLNRYGGAAVAHAEGWLEMVRARSTAPSGA
jgi:glycosyltransferase involved in cell wall biosynthesis